MGVVVTVLGEVPAAQLGPTLCHEHCFMDLTPLFEGESDEPVTMELLGELRVRPFSTTRDNLRLDSYETAHAELRAFAAGGGGALVEMTPIGCGRSPELLRDLSRATGVSIVMGTAFYVEALHPPWLGSMPVDEVAALFVRDLVEEPVRAGVVGEIGVSGAPLSAAEEKVLRAGARAALATGACVSLHLDPREPRPALPALDVLAEEGLPPSQIVAGHMDVVEDLDFHREVAARGVYLGYDQLGCESYADELGPAFSWGKDTWRLGFVRTLIHEGHVDQLLFSHDVALKMDLRSYGGRGYTHVLGWVVPTLERLGVARADLDKILVANPARAFALSP